MKNLRPLRLDRGEINNPFKRRRTKNIVKRLLPLVIVIGVLIALAFFLITVSGTSSYVTSIISGTSLKSTDGRVNVLLLGIAGGSHGGPNLTDTIMVASYNLKTNQVYLFSIPRDLWLPSFRSKVNAVYQTGITQGNGLGLAKTVMGNILGLPIHFAVRIDFNGFIQAVDSLGGIDVVVDNTFDDYNYPIEGKEDDLCDYQEKEIDVSPEQAKQFGIAEGKQKLFIAPDGSIASASAQEDVGAKYFTCRYEHIHFDEGINHMDGTTALKFVRSRHGTNGEASDFARSKRQEKVIEAIRGKVLSLQTLTNPAKISDLIRILGKSIDTDINVKDMLEFYKLFHNLSKTHSFVLDDSQKVNLPNGRTSLLVNPPRDQYGGAYVLISQDDDFSLIQGYIKKLLTGEITDYEQSSFSGKEEATASARTGN